MVMRAFLLCLAAQLHGGAAATSGTADGMERWGYVTVRPKAHIFWWYYKSPKQGSSPGKPWPTVLWLPGDMGESGSGHGNFLGIGPLDTNMNPRKSTWLHKANLLFVDHPVGVGYSYADDESALAKTQLQAALDVIELFKVLPKEIPTLQSSPLYLVGRSSSYGGKMADMIAGSLNLTLGVWCSVMAPFLPMIFCRCLRTSTVLISGTL